MPEILLNDPGALIADAPNKNLLPFPTDKQDANFELGVSMIIHGWHTLTTAVDNLWGGPQSEEKRDWISGVIVDEFTNNYEIDIIYLHELLLGIMEDEFFITLEDGSTVEIATKIVKCYKECKDSIFENIQAMYTKWAAKQQNKQKVIVSVGEDPVNPDISDDEEGTTDDHNGDAMDVDDVELVQSQPKAKQEPEIDDDGFTIVRRR
ncbi:unnamed protein product [Pichia kudriavzevii]